VRQKYGFLRGTTWIKSYLFRTSRSTPRCRTPRRPYRDRRRLAWRYYSLSISFRLWIPRVHERSATRVLLLHSARFPEPQVLHVVLDDVSPSLSLSSSTSLMSLNICCDVTFLVSVVMCTLWQNVAIWFDYFQHYSVKIMDKLLSLLNIYYNDDQFGYT